MAPVIGASTNWRRGQGSADSLAKRAIRLAELDGLITVQRRPRSGRKHLTNIIRIISAEWLDWLRKGRRKTYAINACNRAKPDLRSKLEGYKITRHGHRIFRNSQQRPCG